MSVTEQSLINNNILIKAINAINQIAKKEKEYAIIDYNDTELGILFKKRKGSVAFVKKETLFGKRANPEAKEFVLDLFSKNVISVLDSDKLFHYLKTKENLIENINTLDFIKIDGITSSDIFKEYFKKLKKWETVVKGFTKVEYTLNDHNKILKIRISTDRVTNC